MFSVKTIETNDKLGYYTVGQEKIHHKPIALMRATETNQFPEWHFNRTQLDAQVWDVEPSASLQELYRIRAQQIRDKYDYIRLEFSGGADSTVVLYSFLNNGIFVDEIVTRWPKEAAEKIVRPDPYNLKPENSLSEYEYAAKPILEWVAKVSPNTKITMHDYSEDMLTGEHDESWIYGVKDWLLPSYQFKTSIHAMDEHKRTLDRGKSVCILWGVDKPKLCVRDGKWYVYFMDIQANNCSSDIGAYTNATNEYFFWSPDLPEIVCKQAHTIKNWFENPNNRAYQHLVRWPNYSLSHRVTYEALIKPLVFPEYDPNTFQCAKPTNSFYNEMDAWFYTNHQENNFYKAWQAGLQYLETKIDQKYFHYEWERATGFVSFISPMYCLGDSTFVDAGNNTFLKF
jgi:hypothetical protein